MYGKAWTWVRQGQFKGSFNNYVNKMRGRGSKNVCFCQRSGCKNCPHRGWGVKKWQNSVHVVVECPLTDLPTLVERKSKQTALSNKPVLMSLPINDLIILPGHETRRIRKLVVNSLCNPRSLLPTGISYPLPSGFLQVHKCVLVGSKLKR